MDPTDIPLFSLADRRLSWLDRRMTTLSANVANADTPKFRARDLAPFAAALNGAGLALAAARTSPMHLSGTLPSGPASVVAADTERAPDGNSVSLDTELVRMAQTDASHELVEGLYHKYLGMFRTAAGR